MDRTSSLARRNHDISPRNPEPCADSAKMMRSVAVTATDPHRDSRDDLRDKAHRSIDAVFRMESAKIIGALTRIVRDVGVAEELAQEALVAALEQWPEAGIPDNPGAWLMATAKHRAIDHWRRIQLRERKNEELGRELQVKETTVPDFDSALDDDIGDDVLRLMFISCHPVLSTDARVALTLRLIGGLTTEEIARAFLVPEPTVAQRIVRAKKTLADARIPFEVPQAPDLATRLSSVLEVIYLVFNEGYSATAGDHWMRPALCEEALRLGRILAELVPREPEVHGLIALMEIQASRAPARVGPRGRAGPAPRSKSFALGSTADPPRTRRSGPRRKTRLDSRNLYSASFDCRLPRPRADSGPNRLGTDRHALRRAGSRGSVADRRIESRRGALDGVRSGRGTGSRRRSRFRTRAQKLSSAAKRPRRFPFQASPLRRSPRSL